MSQSQQLRLGDIREVFRLIGDIRERGSDPVIWRRYMLVQLHKMMNSRVGYCIQSRPPNVNGMNTITCLVEEGLGERGLAMGYDVMYRGGIMKDPCLPAIIKLLQRGQHFTRCRHQLVHSDKAWNESAMMRDYYRPMQINELITSQVFLPAPFGQQAINLHRDAGDPRRFSERERRQLHLFHTELCRLWENAPTFTSSPWDGLPPRLVQTLVLLRGGDTEKQIATKLGLSTHTVHDNTKRLHAFYKVSNRASLMAATTPPHSGLNPRLTE